MLNAVSLSLPSIVLGSLVVAVSAVGAQTQEESRRPDLSFSININAGLRGGLKEMRSGASELLIGRWGLGVRLASSDTKLEELAATGLFGSSHPTESWVEWTFMLERALLVGKYQLVTLGAGLSSVSGTAIEGTPFSQSCREFLLPGNWTCSSADYEEVRVRNSIGAALEASYRLVLPEDDGAYGYELIVTARASQEPSLSGISIGVGWRFGGVPFRP
jgi:hypothetical protein